MRPMQKKILIIGMQHGNELLGYKLMSYITSYHTELLEYIDFIVGNPAAFSKKTRYVESDMNRSYNKYTRSRTYEENRAEQILSMIRSASYEIVLDLHTTTANQQPSIIVSSLAGAVRKFLRNSDISTVVMMSENIAAHSLIGNCEQALSIEVNHRELNNELLGALALSIESFIKSNPASKVVTVYEVNGLLSSKDMPVGLIDQVENFKLFSNKFYPILAGEVAYKNSGEYLGFQADKKYQLTV